MLTLSALAQRFFKEANPPTKNPRRYWSWLRYALHKHVLPELGAVRLINLKPGQIEALCVVG